MGANSDVDLHPRRHVIAQHFDHFAYRLLATAGLLN